MLILGHRLKSLSVLHEGIVFGVAFKSARNAHQKDALGFLVGTLLSCAAPGTEVPHSAVSEQ
jgi:hypothetical protein